MVLTFSELLHKCVRTQPKCTEMFKNSNSMRPAYFSRAQWLAAVSKNRPFWYGSLSRNGLPCPSVYSFPSGTFIPAVLAGGGRGLTSVCGGCWESAAWSAAPWGWTLSSTLTETRCVWIKGPFTLRVMIPCPLSITVSKSGAEVKNAESPPRDTNEQKNKLMVRNVWPAVLCWFRLSCILSPLQTRELARHPAVANVILTPSHKMYRKGSFLCIFGIAL